MHHLDSWVKRNQLDVTCFIISLYNAPHVLDVNTSILKNLRLKCWVISWVTLICKEEVFVLACLFSRECLVVTCVVVLEIVFLQILAAVVSYGYRVFLVCSIFLIVFPEYILMSCIWVYTYLVRCVMVLRCGLAVVVWYPYAGWGTCVGVTLWFGCGGVVSVCRLKQCC